MKRLRVMLAMFSLFVGLSALVPSVAMADAKSTVCTTLGSNAGCTSAANGSVDLNTIVRVVIEILSTIIGVVSVIMIMVAGFKYVTSGGDSSAVKSAKDTITYAVVGLVIVAFAQIIVKYVLGKVTK